mmetsp:Transcript_37846/g.81546  ORF Transcript_37846/g.81546 Transcript_37846/m.81546 type:complete len:158 (+) Transcript_37846:182-655(+)
MRSCLKIAALACALTAAAGGAMAQRNSAEATGWSSSLSDANNLLAKTDAHAYTYVEGEYGSGTSAYFETEANADRYGLDWYDEPVLESTAYSYVDSLSAIPGGALAEADAYTDTWATGDGIAVADTGSGADAFVLFRKTPSVLPEWPIPCYKKNGDC